MPGRVVCWLRLKKVEAICKYYIIMKQIRISDLKVGDKLYRINPINGKLLSYTIEKIDRSWFTISNETGYVCASIQCHSIDNNCVNNEYFTHPLLAIWMAIKKIRDEQYRLEQKRINIIKINKIKVKINTFPKKKHWWNKIF